MTASATADELKKFTEALPADNNTKATKKKTAKRTKKTLEEKIAIYSDLIKKYNAKLKSYNKRVNSNYGKAFEKLMKDNKVDDAYKAELKKKLLSYMTDNERKIVTEYEEYVNKALSK